MRQDNRQAQLVFCLLGILPVVWLGLLIAPAVGGGLPEIIVAFPAAMNALDNETGLKAPSVVMLEQIRTLDKHRLEQYVGKLPPKQLKELNHALAISVGLIDPKPKSMTLCLCRTCVDNFFNTGAYFLKRIDPYQIEKETCTYCNQRSGYDYQVIPR